jgi:hypothetical protein
MKQKRQQGKEREEGQLTGEEWHKPFPITSVCRADLREFFSDEEIAGLDDADMREIAREMADAYLQRGCWIDLQIVAGSLLQER